jgi:GH18 family chitinase
LHDVVEFTSLKSCSNVRYRTCNRIAPSQIDTNGLTHLNLAFASIDPTSFNITPTDPGDLALYAQFTALKSAAMQTWIAVGGFDFSDPGPTHTIWSGMCSNSANRAAFISSLIDFMNQWGFQGVDLDWEYPANPSRGGRPEDTKNFVSLVSEMRQAFGTKYGISVTL